MYGSQLSSLTIQGLRDWIHITRSGGRYCANLTSQPQMITFKPLRNSILSFPRASLFDIYPWSLGFPFLHILDTIWYFQLLKNSHHGYKVIFFHYGLYYFVLVWFGLYFGSGIQVGGKCSNTELQPQLSYGFQPAFLYWPVSSSQLSFFSWVYLPVIKSFCSFWGAKDRT